MTTRAQAEALRGLPPETLAARYWEAERRFAFREAVAHLFAAISDGQTLPIELIEDAVFSIPQGPIAATLVGAAADPIGLAEALVKRLDGYTTIWVGVMVLQRVEQVPDWLKRESLHWGLTLQDLGDKAPALFRDAIAVANGSTNPKARQGLSVLELSGEKVLRLLSVEPSGPRLTVRKEERARPNDPCPCGSGAKFKRCCFSKPVAKVSRTLFERTSEIAPSHVEHLEGWDWRSLDLTALAERTLKALSESEDVQYDLKFALRVVAELRRRGLDEGDAALRVARHAWQVHDLAIVDQMMPLTQRIDWEGRELFEHHASFAKAYSALEQYCGRVVRRDDDVLPLEVIGTQWPALSILLTRGAMLDTDFKGRKDHIRSLETLRARMGLGGRDPGMTLVSPSFAKLYEAEAELSTTIASIDRKLSVTRPLIDQLDEANAKVAALEKEGAALRAQLVDPQTAEGQLARLRAKVDELKAELTVTKAMLREARDVEAPAKPEVAPTKDEPIDDGDAPTAEEVEGPPRLVRFDRAAEAALAELPEAVVRLAIERAGELGGGRAGAFREVKRMRGVRHVFSCRLGIHHRMLFTLAPAELVVVEIIHRAALDRALEHLAVAPRPSSPGGRKAHQT